MKVQNPPPSPSSIGPAAGEPVVDASSGSARPADGFRAWLAASGRRRYEAALLKTAWGRVNIRPVLLAEHGVQRASATRYDCLGVLDRRPVRVRAFGDVIAPDATPPDVQAVHTLVEHMVTDARTSGVEVALLFTPLDPGWCREWGFVDITPETLTLRVEPGRRPGAPMVMLRGGEDRDLPAIAAMGQLQAAPFRFSLDRGVDFIQHGLISRRLLAGLAPRGSRELHFFVIEEGSTAVAYVVLSVEAGEWWIDACGDRDPTGHRVGCILQALLARDPSAAPPRIRGWLPERLVPPQVTVVARERTPTAVMAALIAPHATAHRLASSDVLFWKADVF